MRKANWKLLADEYFGLHLLILFRSLLMTDGAPMAQWNSEPLSMLHLVLWSHQLITIELTHVFSIFIINPLFNLFIWHFIIVLFVILYVTDIFFIILSLSLVVWPLSFDLKDSMLWMFVMIHSPLIHIHLFFLISLFTPVNQLPGLVTIALVCISGQL